MHGFRWEELQSPRNAHDRIATAFQHYTDF